MTERGRTGAAPRIWVKVMYHELQQHKGDWWGRREWLPDRQITPSKTPPRGPGYAVGDEIALYLHELRVIAALYRVTGSSEFQPKGVRELDNSTALADTYEWITPVEVLKAVPLDQALPLVELGFDGRALRRYGWKPIHDAKQAERIRSHFGFSG